MRWSGDWKSYNDTTFFRFWKTRYQPEIKREKLHQVFKESFDGKELYNERLIWQKLDYMHYNPVTGKWNLAPDFVRYLHSSARYYETGEHGIYKIVDFQKVIAE